MSLFALRVLRSSFAFIFHHRSLPRPFVFAPLIYFFVIAAHAYSVITVSWSCTNRPFFKTTRDNGNGFNSILIASGPGYQEFALDSGAYTVTAYENDDTTVCASSSFGKEGQTGDSYDSFDAGCGCASAPCTTNLTWNVKNDNQSRGLYVYAIDLKSGIYSNPTLLMPGQSAALGLSTVPCGDVRFCQVKALNGENPSSNDSIFAINPDTGTAGIPGSTPGASESPTTGGQPISSPPISNYNPTNPANSGTNSPIYFTSTNAPIAQEGFNAIDDAINQAAQVAHSDALNIQGALSNSSQPWTNGLTLQQLTNAASIPNTNLTLLDPFSSQKPLMDYVHTAMDTALGGLYNTFNGISYPSVPSGSDFSITIPLGKKQIVFDTSVPPMSTWFDFANQFLRWILSLAFLVMMFNEVEQCIKWVVSMNFGSIQNLEVTFLGTGSNFPGVALYVVLTALTVVIYAALLVLLASMLAGAGIPAAIAIIVGGPVTGFADQGIALLCKVFPLSMAITYMITIIIFRVTASPVAVMAAIALKSIPRG